MEEKSEEKDSLINKKMLEVTEMHIKSRENSQKRLKQIDEHREIFCLICFY